MPQGRMTEEQAFALAKKQRAANDLRRAGGNTGGFKGIEKPGEAVQVMMNGRKAFVSGSAITDDSGPAKPPRNFLNDIGDAAAKSRAVYANRDAGRASNAGPTDAPKPTVATKKPVINMKVGMGNSENYNRANAKPVGEAANELLGSAVHMMQNKGKSYDDARQSLQTLDTFKGLSEAGREYALANFDRWRAGQVKGNKNTMGNLRRASQKPVKPTDNLQMRATDSNTANLARTANRVGILD